MKKHYTFSTGETIEGTHQALKLLKEGNARFVSGHLAPKDHYAEDRLKLSEGQHPFAAVLCCSDSRVAPEILFDQQLGDVFVIRNAGNVVDEDVLGSIEYAVEHLESPLVLVLGHSSCGAVTAACQGGELPGHLVDIAKRIKPSISMDCCIDDNARRHAERMAQLVRENPIVEHLKVTVVAAFYDIASGVVEWM
ncbi:MAG: carbonic anhydrase [Bacteroidales bacterium]|nr:carbonic anhydrase [Bacteroidales bacterium]